jgi:hypothetical protein
MTGRPAWFAARLLFERSFEGDPDAPALFEETVVLLKSAAGLTAAARKAEKLGRAGGHSYKNPDGEIVSWAFCEVLDVIQLAEEELGEGTEVYSHFLSAEGVRELRAALAAPTT